MVLDSADDLDIFFQEAAKDSTKICHPGVAQFVPRSPLGSILVTTRDKRVASRLADRGTPVDVSPMPSSEAEELLHSKLPDELVADSDAVHELVGAPGYLPLGISQAAALMVENNMKANECLATFRQDEADFLSKDRGDYRRPSQSDISLLLVWQLLFKQIKRKEPRAAEILSIMSVLDQNAIPQSLLMNEDERAIDFNRALGILKAYSPIIPENDGTFALQRLVQISMRSYLEHEGTESQWQEKALQTMVKQFPPGD